MSTASRGEPSARIRIRDRIAFRLERLVLRGVGYRLLLAAAIIALVALIAGLLAIWLVDEVADSQAIWWAFLRLSDPGYLGDDEGLTLRTISTIVTVLGYVLFLGLLVAIMTQWLNSKIEHLESGVTPIALRDHVIVFGWTARTPEIVRGLLASRPRVQRFLARIGARRLRVVVLVKDLNEGHRQQIRERLGDLWSDRDVFLRSGSALRAEHLERVAYRDASVLILPGADFGEERPEAVDAKTIKELLAISRTDETPPLAVAEVFDVRRVGTAQRAYEGDSEIMAVDDIVSRIIAQSTRQRGLCAVYSELLTLHGNSIYVRALDGFAGVRYEDARRRFPHAILIGTTPAGQGAPNLAPSPDTRIQPNDLLVFVARGYDGTVPSTEELPACPLSPGEPRPPVESGHRRMLILGWSRKMATLLWELNRQFADSYEVDVVSTTPVPVRERLLKYYEAEDQRLPVRHVQADFRVPRLLEELEPAGYDSILVLASERASAEEEADANTASTYLMLQDLLPEGADRPNLLIELLDPDNAMLFEDVSDDVMVSSAFVSFLLSQVALNRELAAVFNELTSPWGPQILKEPASRYVDVSAPLTFGDIDRAVAARGEIALGVVRRSEPGTGLLLNPAADAELQLGPEDAVVLLCRVAAPPTAGQD
jgi:uncharacterized membrane protein